MNLVWCFSLSRHFSYPLILCFELQCNTSQQERLAQLLIEIFGDKLSLDHLLPEFNVFSNEYRSLPSPNDLRGKIIIKVEWRQTRLFFGSEANCNVMFLFQGKKLPPSFSHEMHQDYGEITDDEDCYEDNKRRSKKVRRLWRNLQRNLAFRIRISSVSVLASLLEPFPIWSPCFVRHLLKISARHSTSVSQRARSSRSMHRGWIFQNNPDKFVPSVRTQVYVWRRVMPKSSSITTNDSSRASRRAPGVSIRRIWIRKISGMSAVRWVRSVRYFTLETKVAVGLPNEICWTTL